MGKWIQNATATFNRMFSAARQLSDGFQAAKDLASVFGTLKAQTQLTNLLGSLEQSSKAMNAAIHGPKFVPEFLTTKDQLLGIGVGSLRSIEACRPPKKPQLNRRTNGRPNYIEYVQELNNLPKAGFWGLTTLELRRRNGPGSLEGDLWLLSDDRISPEKRMAAAERFVERYLSLGLGNPAANNELRRLIGRGGCSQRELWEVTLPKIVFLITEKCDKCQPVRLGRSWIKNRAGRIKHVRPVTLLPHEYSKWLRQQAYRHLEEFIRTEYGRDQRFQPIDTDTFDSPIGLEALVAAESAAEGASKVFIEEAASTLPRAQRRYLKRLLSVIQDCDSVAAALKKTARSLRITATNERQLYKRIHNSLARFSYLKSSDIIHTT